MEVQALMHIIRQYFTPDLPVSTVYLFGSFAKNRNSSRRDLDLALLFASEMNTMERFEANQPYYFIRGFREPQNNKDAFRVLEEQGIVNPPLSGHLQKMTQFRNIIVHDYLRIEPEIVFGIIQNNLADIHEFARVILE